MEVSSYIYPLFKIATSQSNGLRVKDVVELHALDMSWSSGVFAMELCCEGDQSRALQEIPQFKLCYRICYNSPPRDFSEN